MGWQLVLGKSISTGASGESFTQQIISVVGVGRVGTWHHPQLRSGPSHMCGAISRWVMGGVFFGKYRGMVVIRAHLSNNCGGSRPNPILFYVLVSLHG